MWESKEGHHPSCLWYKNLCSRILLFFYCAAQFNFQAFQHSRLRQQTTADLRPKLQRRRAPPRTQNQLSSYRTLELTCARSHMIFTLHAAAPPPPRTPRPSTATATSSAHLWRRSHRGWKGWRSSAAWQSYSSLFLHDFTSTLHSRLSLVFRSLSLSSRRDGLIQVNGAVSDWTELHWWTLPFPTEVPVYFRRSGGSDYCRLVQQDGRDARRQSAAPVSLYCLSLWLAAESKSPAHAFWLMKTLHQWRTPRNSSDLW